MAHFIAVPKLPSAKEAAITLIQEVVQLHGLPIDIVSDRVPQFTTKLKAEFCYLPQFSVSLSSGF